MRSESLSFSVDTQLLDELGKRLVAQDHVALAELVKNAYDADATFVDVSFERDEKGHSCIVVRDDGTGMTYEDIKNRWMRVATDQKRTDDVSAVYGRQRTGSKGIGRFAVLRLSERLKLTAKANYGETTEVTEVNFNWSRLKKEKRLEKISFPARTRTVPKTATGLELRLIRPLSRWTKTDINRLKRDLADVVSAVTTERLGYKPDPGFEVRIGGQGSKQTTLSDEFLNSGWGRLKGNRRNNALILTLQAKFIEDERIELPIPASLSSSSFGLSLDIAWFPQAASTWRLREIATRETTTKLLEEQSGIRVYLNSNRVFPYGEKGDDWLRLEHKQASRVSNFSNDRVRELAETLGLTTVRSMLDSPRPQRLTGRVEVRQGPQGPLVPTTDRMGFLDNRAFQDLAALIQSALEWYTLQYTRSKLVQKAEQAARSPQQKGETALERISSANSILKKVLRDDPPIILNSEAAAGLGAAGAMLVREAQFALARAEVLERAASSAALLFVFAHEVHAVLRTLAVAASEIEALSQTATSPELMSTVDAVRSARTELRSLMSFVGMVGGGGREEPSTQNVGAVVEETVRGFGVLIRRYGIEVEIIANAPTSTRPMNKSALLAVLVNLLSNSIKAVLSRPRRRIRVTVHTEPSEAVIAISDTGVGLRKENWERVFEPFVSDPENTIYPGISKSLGDAELVDIAKGSGLGLSIARSTLQRVGGTIRFVQPPTGWSTTIEVRVPSK